MSNFDFNTFGTKLDQTTQGSFDFNSFGTEAGPVESTPYRSPFQKIAANEPLFPAQPDGSAVGNFGRYVGNIPGSAYNLTRAAIAPVNPLDIESPINIGSNLVGIYDTSKDLLAQNDGSVLKTTAAVTKSVLEDLPGLAKKGFNLWKQMGESIYNRLEQNVVAEDSVTKGVLTTGGEGLSRVAEYVINDPALVPALLYAPGRVLKGEQVTEDTITKLARPVVKPVEQALESRRVGNTAKDILTVEKQYADTRKAMDFSDDGNAGSRERIASSGVLKGSVDESGVILTSGKTGPAATYRAMTIGNVEGVVRDMLEVEGLSVGLGQLRKALWDEISTAGLEGKALRTARNNLKKEIDGLRLRGDGVSVPLTAVQNSKIATYMGINYKSPPNVKTYAKAVARAYKKTIEKTSKLNVAEVNKVLSKYEKDIDLLESLDGKRVAGGKLGKYFAQIGGQVTGAVIGATIGGIPGSVAGGFIGGGVANTLKSRSMQRTFKYPGKPLPKEPALEKAKAYVQSKSPEAREKKNSNKNSDKNVIKDSIPQKKGIVTRAVENIKESAKNPSIGLATKDVSGEDSVLNRATKYLRESKGLSANDIMKKYPDIQLKQDVVVKNIHGQKQVIPEGEVLTPYELKGNKVLLQDGKTYVVSKNQFQNVKGQSLSGEAKPFAPELTGTEETVLGASRWEGDELYDNGDVVANLVKNDNGTWSYQSDFSEGSDTFKTRAEAMAEAEQSTVGDVFSERATKYSSYTLPGGENYKEILIKAPTKPETKLYWDMEQYDKFPKEVTKVFEKHGDDGYAIDKELQKLGYEVDMDMGGIISGFGKNPTKEAIYKSSHWDEPNVLAHLRMNERTYKGKKVAFMEELQSDWAREGRSKGFIQESKPITVDNLPTGWSFVESKSAGGYYLTDDIGNTMGFGTTKEGTLREFAKNEHLQKPGVPNNPLLKNWQELSIKRALKEAVDSNAEYFAWINGEQTSARYNLATQVDEIRWKENLGDREIAIKPKTGGVFDFSIGKDGTIFKSRANNWNGKKLDEVLGKGLADKIMEKESGTLSGEGLKFGGEWASNLYDKQVGDIVRKVTGGKVEEIDLGLPVANKKPSRFIKQSGRDVGGPVSENDLKVGLEINEENIADDLVITEVVGNGKFRAIPKINYNLLKEKMSLSEMNKLLATNDFDLRDTRTATQQAIELTPDIKRVIRGEAPELRPLEEFLSLRNSALNQ